MTAGVRSSWVGNDHCINFFFVTLLPYSRKNLPIVSQNYISIITVKKKPLAEKELRNSRQMIADKNPAPLDAWTLVPLDHLIRCVPLERDAAAAAAGVHLDDLLLDSLSLFFFFLPISIAWLNFHTRAKFGDPRESCCRPGRRGLKTGALPKIFLTLISNHVCVPYMLLARISIGAHACIDPTRCGPI